MLLGPRETVLRSAYAMLDPSASGGERRRPGVLYLTNERLVFEAPASRGLVRDFVKGRETELLVNAPLLALHNANVQRGRFSRVRLVVDLGVRRPAFDVLEPDEWLSAIAEARRIPHGAGSEPVVALGHPHHASSVKLRCRYCGGLADEGQTRCPSCGAPL